MNIPNGADLVLTHETAMFRIAFARLSDIPIRPASTGPRYANRTGLKSQKIKYPQNQLAAILHWNGQTSALQRRRLFPALNLNRPNNNFRLVNSHTIEQEAIPNSIIDGANRPRWLMSAIHA